MRTVPGHILPGCRYCNDDHNPDIQCRFLPESGRFWLNEPKPKTRMVPTIIRDADGKAIGVKMRRNEDTK
jgi:hypothetical protein